MYNQKILVIVQQWPSKTHPYLMWLFSLLKQDFSNLTLMLFEKPTKQYGYEILGKKKTDEVLAKALFKQAYTLNPVVHIKTIIISLMHLKQSIAIIKECKQNGLSVAQTYGQFLYYHTLLGKQFDLVHINALQTAYHIKAKAWFGSAKVLVSSRGQDFDFFPDRYDAVLQRADHVHVLGTYLKNKVKNKGIDENKITIIAPAYNLNNTIDTNPKEITQNQTIHIATAARFEWVKGFRYCISTIENLIASGNDVHYHIFGDGMEREELAYLIKSKNLSNYITIHNWVAEDELKVKLSSCQIYLLLSIAEAFNNSVVLAQSLGLPCVVSQAGGLPENVINNQTGFVVSSYNSEEAAQAVRNLFNNPKLYATMSANAIERVKSLLINRQVQKYGKLYRDIFAK